MARLTSTKTNRYKKNRALPGFFCLEQVTPVLD